MSLNFDNLLTTNYDLALESCMVDEENLRGIENKGCLVEQRYSVFRKHTVGKNNIWHIHGSINHPNSIMLGYEHYSGYLQAMRNYVVTGTKYKNKSVNELGTLVKRLPIKSSEKYSWIDEFFSVDIFIIGLRLDFVEIDLWWLLTFRARQVLKNDKIRNKIYYYIPSDLKEVSKPKLELLESIGVIVLDDYGSDFQSSKKSEEKYYKEVIGDIKNRTGK